ncbi:hypothetical protein [Curtobacterium aetherium]|uniref:Uncharacterized protein n=1 Tax=Curtobacterium aetherium TaxID=2841594 RepID=A0ACD1E168_9MICO|nr:hypothetical protein [Curtobacterium sp. L6-1]QWS32610.1 hypothetical protein KM842_09935 [Curtobacterium sp. L6-1]
MGAENQCPALGEGTLVTRLQPSAAHAIATYTPQLAAERWQRIRLFVRDAVAVIAPACAWLAERLMVVVAGHVDWVANVCEYPLQAAVVFHPVMIRRYISRDDVERSDKTRRDYRSLLLRVSEVVVPTADPLEFSALNGQSVTMPYTDLELTLLESWARGQANAQRRRSASVLLALSAGAGLDAWEVQHLQHSDVCVTSSGIVIDVDGATPRQSVVNQRWEQLLLDGLRGLSGDRLVFGAADRETTFNIVTKFIRHTDRGNEPNPMPKGMRATWIAGHLAAQTPADLLMRAAGTTKAAHLAASLVHVPDLHTAVHRRRLLAEARGQSTR